MMTAIMTILMQFFENNLTVFCANNYE